MVLLNYPDLSPVIIPSANAFGHYRYACVDSPQVAMALLRARHQRQLHQAALDSSRILISTGALPDSSAGARPAWVPPPRQYLLDLTLPQKDVFVLRREYINLSEQPVLVEQVARDLRMDMSQLGYEFSFDSSCAEDQFCLHARTWPRQALPSRLQLTLRHGIGCGFAIDLALRADDKRPAATVLLTLGMDKPAAFAAMALGVMHELLEAGPASRVGRRLQTLHAQASEQSSEQSIEQSPA